MPTSYFPAATTHACPSPSPHARSQSESLATSHTEHVVPRPEPGGKQSPEDARRHTGSPGKRAGCIPATGAEDAHAAKPTARKDAGKNLVKRFIECLMGRNRDTSCRNATCTKQRTRLFRSRSSRGRALMRRRTYKPFFRYPRSGEHTRPYCHRYIRTVAPTVGIACTARLGGPSDPESSSDRC